MHIYSILASVMTVVSLTVFLGIVWWAWSGRRKDAFAQAAQEPFALPDEGGEAPRGTAQRREPRAWGPTR